MPTEKLIASNELVKLLKDNFDFVEVTKEIYPCDWKRLIGQPYDPGAAQKSFCFKVS